MTMLGVPSEPEKPEPKIHKRANSKLKRLKDIIHNFAICFFHQIPKVSTDIYVHRNTVKITFLLKGSSTWRPTEGLPDEATFRRYENELKSSFNDIFFNDETNIFYDFIGMDCGYLITDEDGCRDIDDHPEITIYAKFGQVKRISKKNFLKIEKRLERELVFLKIQQ